MGNVNPERYKEMTSNFATGQQSKLTGMNFKHRAYDSESYEPAKANPYPHLEPNRWEKGTMNLVKSGKLTPYGAGFVGMFDPGAYASAVIDMIPWAKWTVSKERWDQYTALPPEEKKIADIHETIVGAWFASGFLVGPAAKYGAKTLGTGIKYAGKGITRLTKGSSVIKATPFEDTVSWAGKHYDYDLRGILAERKFGKLGRLAEDEQDAVARYMGGNMQALSQPYIKTTSKIKDGVRIYDTPTEAFRSITKRSPSVTPRWDLAKEDYAEFTTEAVRRSGLLDKFKMALPKTTKGEGVGATATLQAQAERFYGKDLAAKMDMSKLSSEQIHKFQTDLFNSPFAQKTVRELHEIHPLSWLEPVRKVLGGRVNKNWGTYDKYVALKGGFDKANEFAGNQLNIFNEMAVQRGLMTFKKGKYKWSIDKKDLDDAGLVVKWKDQLLRQAHSEKDPKRFQEAISQAYGEIAKKKVSGATQAVLDTVYAFDDHLYYKGAMARIEQTFVDSGLSSFGANGLPAMLREVDKAMLGVLKTSAGKDYITRVSQLSEVLDDVYSIARRSPQMFKAGADEVALKGVMKNLRTKLTLPTRTAGTPGITGVQIGTKTPGEFLPYIDETLSRVYSEDLRAIDGMVSTLDTKAVNTYRTLRREGKVDLETMTPTNLAKAVVGKVHAQGKQMFLHPEVKDIIEFNKTLPNNIANYNEHLVARLLGLPSNADYMVGRALSAAKLPGNWDAYRTMRAARTVNDFTYMGFLGFKPFSAARNLFQPFLMVPADLGGIKDYYHLAKGWKFASTKQGRHELNKIGILGEYLPEHEIGHQLPSMHKTIAGAKLPTLDNVRDASLWMFKYSDRFNRFVSGGAAFSKWEAGLAKVVGKGNNASLTKSQLKQAMSNTGARLRTEPVKGQIKEHLRRGNYEEARKLFVKDVVADTQYLYGSADSPLLSQKAGGVGRTAMVFQSWWMNYGSAMKGWLTTGTATDRTKRMVNWMISGAIAYQGMKQVWGSGTARRTVLLGPFPDPSQGFSGNFTPPAWKPVLDAAGLAMAAGEIAWTGDTERFKRQGIKMIKHGVSFTPGGLQSLSSFAGARAEGWAGLGKSFLKIQPD